MKNKFIAIFISLVGLCFSLGCGSLQETEKVESKIPQTVEVEPYQKNNITSLQVEPYGCYGFVLRYSNIIYEYKGYKYKGKELKFPIFQGTFGDLFYDDFQNYCENNGLLRKWVGPTGFVIKCRKGEIKKTILEFVNFYKSNILKDIDIEKPDIMPLYGLVEILSYSFVLNGVPCTLRITYAVSGLNTDTESLSSIKPDENAPDTSFWYDF